MALHDGIAVAVVVRHFVGVLDVVCEHCAARFFPKENHHCCTQGAVSLPLWRVPPEPLLSLLRDDDFRLKIRGYNCAFSLGSSVFSDLTASDGPATFQMAGRSWHLLPRCLYPDPCGPKAAQIYALPVQDAVSRRSTLTTSASRSPLSTRHLASLHTMLLESNALVRSFERCAANQQDWNISVGALEPHATAVVNDSMVGLLVNGGCLRHSVVVPLQHDGSLVVVPDLDPYYQPLHFVLLFPHGEPQWGLHLNRTTSDQRPRKRSRSMAPLTILDYLRFHIQRRSSDVNVCSIHWFGRLFEEWFVDSFLQQENHKLHYIKRNQSLFRSESYSRLQQQLLGGDPARQIGSPATHLPSSFVRSARHFRELYADAMALPAKYGGIDYFVTFTTNPAWPEIVDNASLGTGMNSPDMYCRVFHLKMRALLYDILSNGVFGVVVAYTWSVEFQQRGLPHLHALFIVRPEDKPHSQAMVDAVVSAQLPNAAADPFYFTAVTKHMLHGPCGVHKPKHYCMKNGRCRFDYPKRLAPETTIPADGYTNLARPVGPSFFTESFTYDNGWVVPHNRYLLLKYDAHINVECSASISVVKYMFKYIFKGSKSSCAAVTNEHDEIQQFSDGRITSAAEAMWNVLRFEMHSQLPTVVRLGCNLPCDPVVIFDPTATDEAILTAAAQQKQQLNHLLGWFTLNRCDESARSLLYVEIPTSYTWNEADRKWQRRKNRCSVLGRLYPVDPASREGWAMRTLLLHARGCTSEIDVRTVNHVVWPSFVEAALAAGLLDDDREYHRCLTAAISAHALRCLFLVILTKCYPHDPAQLLLSFFDELTDDFDGDYYVKEQKLYTYIADRVEVPLDSLGLNLPQRFPSNRGVIFLESFVSTPIDGRDVDVCNLNAEQRCAHDCIINGMVPGSPGCIVSLLAPAGTGKTFLINAILSTCRQRGLRLVPCATSGLAASLLGRARTAHTTFKIPVNLDEGSICKPSAAYKYWLRSIDAFIWDEISMAHQWAISAVDRMLQDIHGVRLPFGGRSVIFCGDMQQLLPVHRFARDPAAYCVNTCSWFPNALPLQLHQNMRAIADPSWAVFVAAVGQGDDITFPASCCVDNVQLLIDAVWPDRDYLSPRLHSILTMTRADSAAINTTISALCPGVSDYSFSLDEALDCENKQYPIEFVHSVSLSGVPDHMLVLQKGAPYMVMHNTSPALCNGTRVTYLRRVGKCLEVQICSGALQGEIHYLPRLILSMKSATLPFTLRRVQYPLMLCWAMTVHKAQGQTLDRVGIFFSRPTWAHGILYVAVSRVRRQQDCFWVGAINAMVANYCSKYILSSSSTTRHSCAIPTRCQITTPQHPPLPTTQPLLITTHCHLSLPLIG